MILGGLTNKANSCETWFDCKRSHLNQIHSKRLVRLSGKVFDDGWWVGRWAEKYNIIMVLFSFTVLEPCYLNQFDTIKKKHKKNICSIFVSRSISFMKHIYVYKSAAVNIIDCIITQDHCSDIALGGKIRRCDVINHNVMK
jgi:hypothetical protein